MDQDMDQEVALRSALRQERLADAGRLLREFSPVEVERFLDRSDPHQVPIVFRLLDKELAVQVFAALDPRQQSQLIRGLRDENLQQMFGELHASSQARLLDEVPAEVARRLMAGLGSQQRADAGRVLGYPSGSVGRRMSPVLVQLQAGTTAEHALRQIREARIADRHRDRLVGLPVVDADHKVLGTVGLADLVCAAGEDLVEELAASAGASVLATEDDETVARLSAEHHLLALPVTDETGRLVGVLTLDDAVGILEDEESEDSARSAGAEPLAQPYLSTPVTRLVRSRVVWLLVLAVGATLTVQVLEVFEQTLEQLVVLSIFIPLLIGTGGNTGNQAATTVTRALALGDVRARDALRVLRREFLVGLMLGTALGTVGLLIAGLVYSWGIGLVIGLTLLAICTVAATVGSLMPIVAKRIGVDPAVFSNPFITTVVDALGLVVYFLIARAVLGI
ncbi:magnesium transporter [Micrococcus terreus]|uniref:magnesium transporter n=1 Tax=Micrococcus terreus TaxID=574650 RepID=UPI003D76466D